jgi:hypothetical protein
MAVIGRSLCEWAAGVPSTAANAISRKKNRVDIFTPDVSVPRAPSTWIVLDKVSTSEFSRSAVTRQPGFVEREAAKFYLNLISPARVPRNRAFEGCVGVRDSYCAHYWSRWMGLSIARSSAAQPLPLQTSEQKQ